MSKVIVFVIVSALCQGLNAQESNVDSVLRLLKRAPEDTAAFSRYFYIASHYHFTGNDSTSTMYLKKAVTAAVKNNQKREELLGRFLLIDVNNPATGLSKAIECLKLSEAIPDTVGMITSSHFINLVYTSAEEYSKALEYSKNTLNIASAAKDSFWYWNGLYAVANAFISLQKADSGLYYAQEAYRVSVDLKNFNQRWLFGSYDYPRNLPVAWSLHALGKAQQLLKDDELAINYFKKGLEFAPSASTDQGATAQYIQACLSLS